MVRVRDGSIMLRDARRGLLTYSTKCLAFYTIAMLRSVGVVPDLSQYQITWELTELGEVGRRDCRLSARSVIAATGADGATDRRGSRCGLSAGVWLNVE